MRIDSLRTNLMNSSWQSAGSATATPSLSSAGDLLDLLKIDNLASNAGTMLSQSLEALAKQTDLSSRISIKLKTGESQDLLSGYEGASSSGQSRYVQAKLSAMKASRQMKNKMDDNLFDLVDQFGGVCVSGTNCPNSAGGSGAGIKAALKQQGARVLVKEAEQDFKKARDAAEQQAARDAAPKDATGKAILIGGDAVGDTPSTDPAASVPGNTVDPTGAVAATDPGDSGQGASADPAATPGASAGSGQAAHVGAAVQRAAGSGDASQTAGSVDVVV